MGRFRLEVDFISTDLIEIEASSEEEARAKFDAGDWDDSDERNINYTLHEFVKIEALK